MSWFQRRLRRWKRRKVKQEHLPIPIIQGGIRLAPDKPRRQRGRRR
jgi:hypothetical protein